MEDVVRSREAALSAHRRSTQVSDTDLVNALVQKLGTRIVAYMVEKDVSTLSRWKSGSTRIPDAESRSLRVAYQVFQLLESAEADPTIRAWFIGMNPQLDDASPTEAIRDGLHRDVMAAARAFLAGG